MQSFIEHSLFFGPVISLAVYEGGLLLKRKYKLAVLNPLLITAIVLIAFLALTNVEYESYNESAKYISYFLTPATVALAVPLYEQLKLLKENLAAVLCGLLTGVLTSLSVVMPLIFSAIQAVRFKPRAVCNPSSEIHHHSHRDGSLGGNGRYYRHYSGGYLRDRNDWGYHVRMAL